MPDLAAAGLSATMEDYLEAIYQLQEQHQVARVRDIARHLGVKMPSVSAALKTLSGRELVEHEAYGYVTLTDEGRQLAGQVHLRHHAIVELLQAVMLLPEQRAEDEACRLEHALSTESLERLRLLTQFIQQDEAVRQHWLQHLEESDLCEVEAAVEPPRPAKAAPAELTLDTIAPGSTVAIVRVCGEGPIRRRLLDMGLRPGAEIHVERLAPLGDPIEIVVMDYHLTLRRTEAVNIHVRLVEAPLSQMVPGQRVQLVRIRGGAGRQRRVAAQGLELGVEATVLEPEAGHRRVRLELPAGQADIGAGQADDLIVKLL